MADELTIGAVARQAGLRASAIRYYERIGLLPPPERVNGRRRYRPDAVVALGVIGIAKAAGFTLDEIRTLLDGFSDDTPPSERWKSMARVKLEELDALISRAEGMKALLNEGLACDCLRLADCAVLTSHFPPTG